MYNEHYSKMRPGNLQLVGYGVRSWRGASRKCL